MTAYVRYPSGMPRFSSLFLFSVVLLLTGCGPIGGSTDSEGFENFKDAAASDRNYDVYWLGRSFQAGNLVFEGPEVGGVEGIGDVEGGG